MDRNWVVSENEKVGSIVARVNARDDQDDPLEFGLAPHPGFGNVVETNRSLSFRIDNETGTVYTNESLVGRVSHSCLILFKRAVGQTVKKHKTKQDICYA